MLKQYDILDAKILSACRKASKSLLLDRGVLAEARRLAEETGREMHRIIDQRSQFLRRAGRIAFDRKSGWRCVDS